MEFKVRKGREGLSFKSMIVVARSQTKAKPSHLDDRRESAIKQRL
jgi:hypothetical protein